MDLNQLLDLDERIAERTDADRMHETTLAEPMHETTLTSGN